MPLLLLPPPRLCPEGVEATLYASLMSLNNAAMGTAALLGAGMTKLFSITSSNFDHLSLLLLTCNLMSLLPLPLVGWVPDSSTNAATAAAGGAAAAAAAGGGGEGGGGDGEGEGVAMGVGRKHRGDVELGGTPAAAASAGGGRV
jgi:hypothetical protein